MSNRSSKSPFITPFVLTAMGLLSLGTWFGCSSSTSDKGDEAAGGTADPGAGGTTEPGAGGAVDTGVGGGDPCAPCKGAVPAACTPVAVDRTLITDFSTVTDGVFLKDASGEAWTSLFGGTYTYPALDACAEVQPANPLATDMTGGNWHITGTVGTYSGFGLWFGPCSVLDLSAYTGISFTISGTTTGDVTLNVGSASNTAPSTNPDDPTCVTNSATCTPTDAADPGKSCAASSIVLPTITAAPQTVTVLWSDLAGGLPSATPVVTAITSFQWVPAWDWQNTAADAYPIDLVIDDLTLIP